MPTITAKVSDELLAYIDQVSGGNRSEYLRRCLEAGPGDLESGLKIVTNQLSDVNRKLDYLFDRASDADFGSLRDELGNDSNLLIVFYVQIMPDDFVMQLHRF